MTLAVSMAAALQRQVPVVWGLYAALVLLIMGLASAVLRRDPLGVIRGLLLSGWGCTLALVAFARQWADSDGHLLAVTTLVLLTVSAAIASSIVILHRERPRTQRAVQSRQTEELGSKDRA